MTASAVRTVLRSTHEWVGVTAEKLILGETLATTDLYQIFRRSIGILRHEPSLLDLKHAECRVVGKLYGCLDDLLAIFRQFGWPSKTIYVFLGNYVCLDLRGRVQISVLLMLLLFKIVYPTNILMLRGLSECEHCATEMGLIDVCLEQFSLYIYQDLVQLFKYLPLAALVGGVYFMSCGSLALSRGYLIDYEVVDRPRTTCSRANNRLAYAPQRLSKETLRRFRYWDREQEGEDYRNLRLFLKWNGLKAVVKSADVDWYLQVCPQVEGPGNSLVSFQSASVAEDQPVKGSVMIIHRNLCCTFHPIKQGGGVPLDVRMMYPDPAVNEEKRSETDTASTRKL